MSSQYGFIATVPALPHGAPVSFEDDSPRQRPHDEYLNDLRLEIFDVADRDRPYRMNFGRLSASSAAGLSIVREMVRLQLRRIVWLFDQLSLFETLFRLREPRAREYDTRVSEARQAGKQSSDVPTIHLPAMSPLYECGSR